MARRTLSLLALALVVLVALGGSAYALSRPEAPPEVKARLAVAEALGGDGSGFARATDPRPFAFPQDHGPHPDYRSEWWYYTGNLATADGRHFGFQLTFFRTALAPGAAARASDWATNQMYMAHFALSDVDGKRFYNFERFSRGAAGLAGAEASPFRVWLDDWSATGSGGNTLAPVRLRAAQGDVSLDLILAPGKPLVLQGDRGLSRKGPEPGNASYYYSFTRLPTTGSVRVDGTTFPISGQSWMDREWSTSSLGADLVGWDWFALQLSDGRDLMFYRLRRKDGTADPLSGGLLVAPDGSTRALALADVVVAEQGQWRGPRDGATYPARWRLQVPAEGIDLEITPYLPDQELDVSVRYWEGAVHFAGTAAGRPVTGDGYVELTGYADSLSDTDSRSLPR
ncbi:MAG: lipocalin-like domain-containing protein [Chloroflexota bacterium]